MKKNITLNKRCILKAEDCFKVCFIKAGGVGFVEKVILSIFFLSLILVTLKGKELYTRGELSADLDSLYVGVEEIHPHMFYTISREEFEEKLNGVRQRLKEEMTIFEFYILIAPLIAGLGDGHTSVSFPFNSLSSEALLFPYAVKVDYEDTTVVITHSLTGKDDTIPPDSQIISINGVDIKEITGEMLNMISGEKISFRAAMLNQMFRYLLYAIFGEPLYTIHYRSEQTVDQQKVSGITYKEVYRFLQELQEKDKEPDYSFTIDKDKKIAVIDFNRFHDLARFETFLDSVFTNIQEQQINDLIIDIRQNPGGSSLLGDEFFQYIAAVPFQQFGRVVIKTSDRQVEFHKERFQREFHDYSLGIKEYEIDELHELRDNPLRFQGNTYLLTSNFSFSSASSFAWAFQYFDMGTIAGEETGGLAVSFGDTIIQSLPYTGLHIAVSHKEFYHYGATDENRHGTIPDYEVAADGAKDYVIKLIMDKRR